MTKPIFVTQPYLPPLEEFAPYLQQIWVNTATAKKFNNLYQELLGK